MRRCHTALTTVLVAATLALTACSGSSGSAGTSQGGRTTIDITIKDGKVTPHGGRVKAKVGKAITLHIDADEAGQIHVHSTPEQHIDFAKGVSDKKLTVDKPGIVDVEDHALDQVIVQLQVS
jgi:major membrane immunogen (membrane-anchored lipoprotein)